MGVRGPRPKPTAIRKREGNPGKRGLNSAEPVFAAAGVPEPPAWLLDLAKTEWRRVAPELAAAGVLPSSALQALAGYCQSYARWREAEEWLTEHGITLVIKDKDGRVTGVREMPHVKIARDQKDAMRRFAAEFGLTPATAAGVTAKKAPTASKFDRPRPSESESQAIQ